MDLTKMSSEELSSLVQQIEEERNRRARETLMKLLDETKKEYDAWPEWKKAYAVSSRYSGK